MRFILACFLFAFFCTPSVQAQETTGPSAIGTIAEIEGVTAIADGGEAVIPQVGREIYLNDRIETGPDSRMLLVFIDDTELTLGENANLTIDEYVFDPANPAANKGRFSILRGAFILASGLISKREDPDVQIETSYGSIGIRGTVVWGGVLDDEYNVFVQEGEVTFATERGRVTVRPGEGTRVGSRRSIPARAKAWGQMKIGRAVQSVALRHPERVKARMADIRARHAAIRDKRKNRAGDRQENRPQGQEQRQERREDIRQNRQEKRQQRENRTDIHNPARDLEIREKLHLKRQPARPAR